MGRVLDSILRRFTAFTPVSSSFKWHYFVDRSALFTKSFRRHRGIVSAKQKLSAASLNLPVFRCELFGSPLICSATVLCGGMRLLPAHTSTKKTLALSMPEP